MQLGDAQLQRLARFLHHLLDAQLEAVRIAFLARKGAELAAQNAIIRVIDVPVENIAGPVAHLATAGEVGHRSQRVQVLALEQP